MVSSGSSRPSHSFRRLVSRLFLIALIFAPLSAYASGAGEATDMSSRMTTLVIQFGIILFAARAGGKIFEKIGMPGVLGELCTGILIGPSLLGGIPIPGFFEHGLFAVAPAVADLSGMGSVTPELYGICTIASIVLLFLVGVETDLTILKRFAVAGGLVGLGGVICSYFVGAGLGVLLLPTIPAMAGKTFTLMSPACIFLGVMSTATSVSISARILADNHKLDSPEGVTILAAAVIDDVLGIIVLAIGMGLVDAEEAGSGVKWAEIGWIAIKAFGIWLSATIVGLFCARYISTFLKIFEDKTQIATMALGLALIISGLFEEAHLAMIVGAYVIGLSLSRTDISQVIREHLQPIYLFMVPVFFVVMGMMVDLSKLRDPAVLKFGLIYSLFAILAKVVGCGLPTFLSRFNGYGALRVGLGMVPRGEVALIVAGAGLAKGVITQEVFGVAILMTLVTTVLPPPLLVRVFSNPRRGLRKGAPEVPPLPELAFNFPTVEVTSLVVSHLLATFREEGFFVHTLDFKNGIYTVLKDRMSISIKAEPRSVNFRCTEEEMPFVRMAMTEVVAEIEQTMKALQHPLDTNQLLHNNADSEEVRRHVRNARMCRYLRPERMIPDLKVSSKAEAIETLVNHLGKLGLVQNIDAALESVLRREESLSTGLSHGFACPHARTSEVKDLVCVIALVPDGVEFDSLDGQPTKVIQLVLSPADSVTPYMEFMASMGRGYTEKGREELLTCKTSQEMYVKICKRLSA